MSDDEQVLSSAEVGALLEGVAEGAVPTSGGVRTSGEVTPYEFASNCHVSSYCPASLVNLYGKLCRRMAEAASEMLRREVTVGLDSLRRHRYDDYLATINEPVCINTISARGLPGVGLVVMDATLSSTIVEHYYGGGQPPAPADDRPLTPAEMRMCAVFLDLVLRQLTQVWSTVDDISFQAVSVETNPRLVTVAAPSESMLVAKLAIGIGEAACQCHVSVPLTMLAPVRAKLAASGQGRLAGRDQFLASVRAQLRGVSVELVGTLCEIPLTLREVVALAPGDVLPVDLPESVALCADDIPVLLGRFGNSRGNNAVSLRSRGTGEPLDDTPQTLPNRKATS